VRKERRIITAYLKAAYRFFRHPEVQPDTVQAGHREQVLVELEKPGR
jgi:hypothetical protein